MGRNARIVVALVLSLLVITGTDTAVAQVDWTVHGSPVLDVGPPGSWDEYFAAITAVMYDEGIYKAWYNGAGAADIGRMGYATSPDGIVWTKYAGNPVLDVGPPGSFDAGSVDHASVLKIGSVYHTWYSAEDGATNRIGHATSDDGIVWTKDDAFNPVLNVGLAGSWDESEVFHAAVHFDGVTYHMWYNGFGQGMQRTGYATSTDGVIWSKDMVHNPVLTMGAPGTFDDFQLAVQAVIRHDNEYKMWYGGGDGFAGDEKYYRIGYATSPDGFTWTKYGANPVLDVGASGNWDSVAVLTSAVWYDPTASAFKMWYGGLDATGGRTGYAVSSPVTGMEDGNGHADLPDRFGVAQNYPNPFNLSTTIEFSLPVRGRVTIEIFNVVGQRLRSIAAGDYPAGYHTVAWDGHTNGGEPAASGVYFYRVTAGRAVLTRKMVLLK